MVNLPKEVTNLAEKKLSMFYKIMKKSLKVKDENILVITDYGKNSNSLAPIFGYGYYHAAKKKGLNADILFQEVKKGFMQADNHIVDALRKLDKQNIIIASVSNKIGRFGEEKSFRTFCKERGHRFISATGLGDVSSNYFNQFMEAMSVNYPRLQKKGLYIKKLWDKAETIQIKTALGTDITFDVSGMEAIANIGQYHEPGHGGNMPAGEVYMPPQGYGGVNGKIVIDGSMKTEDGALLLAFPLTMTVKDGRVINIEGQHADLLEKILQKFEDRAKYPERVRFMSEIAIGINPGAVLIGSMIMDEKVLGTGHVALGSNYWFGGAIKTIYHGDHVFKNPIFYVDGKKMDV